MNKGIGFLLVLLLVSGMNVWGQCSPDFTPPTIICPPTQMMFLNGNCQVSLPDFSSQTTITDVCDPNPTILQSPTPGTVLSGSGTAITVALIGRDASFNSSTCTFTAITQDNTPPTLTCPGNQILPLNPNCQALLPDYSGMATRSDNCSSTIGITQSPAAGTPISGAGNTVVTIFATDNANNVDSCTFTVTHIDNVAPTPMCNNISLFLNGSGTADFTPSDLDNGSSDNCGNVSLSTTVTSFSCNDIGSNSVILNVEDVSGNRDSCTSTVTVSDSTAPTAVCQNISLYLDGTGAASALASDLDGGSSDNCGTPTLLSNTFSYTCADLGANSAILNVSDGNGNSSACTSTITVFDSTAPSANCQDLTVFLDLNSSASVLVADVDNGSQDNCGIVNRSLDSSSFSCNHLGSNQVTLSVTDASGNMSQCNSTIEVVDSISPTAICQDITVFLDGTGNASAQAQDVDGGSSDNCGPATILSSQFNYTCANTGINQVTLNVDDANGNSSSCTATIDVIDSLAPQAVCQDLTVYLDGNGSASLNGPDLDGGSSDNCGSPTVLNAQFNYTCANLGNTTATLNVNDASGNSDSCSATISVLDSTAPVANCQDITVFLNPNNIANIAVADVNNGSQDNCGIVNQSLDSTMFDCSNLGNNSVTLSLTDGSGNTSQCIGTVTVVDSTSPTALCSSGNLLLDATGNATLDLSAADAGSSDNCGIDSIVYTNPQSFNCSDAGTVASGTLLVYDAEGNVDSCQVNRSVEDEIPPVAVCQDDTIYLIAGLAALDANDLDGGSTDNCGLFSASANPDTFFMADLGTNSVVVMVGDSSGNVDSCLSTVTVLDTTSSAILDNLKDQLNLSFFPNPTKGQVILRWEDAQVYFGETVQVNVINSLGQVVIQDKWIVQGDREEHNYDLSPMGAGIYIFEFRLSSGKVLHKVLKQQ